MTGGRRAEPRRLDKFRRALVLSLSPESEFPEECAIRREDDEAWMEQAIQLAVQAGESGEVPVGAVIVRNGEMIGGGRNRMVERCDPRAHAEMLAIDDAAENTGATRLDGDTLYVTLEPCPQCAGAILLVRLRRVVFGAWDSRLGAAGSQFDLLGGGILGDVRVRPEVLQDRCASLLTEWFKRERR